MTELVLSLSSPPQSSVELGEVAGDEGEDAEMTDGMTDEAGKSEGTEEGSTALES